MAGADACLHCSSNRVHGKCVKGSLASIKLVQMPRFISVGIYSSIRRNKSNLDKVANPLEYILCCKLIKLLAT